jgi:hypothetical protein
MRFIYIQLHNRTATPHDDDHMAHCLAYLHQIIMCMADDSLEPGTRELLADGTYTTTSMAEGTVHQCRDWQHLMDFAKTNFLEYQGTYLGGHATEPGLLPHRVYNMSRRGQ